ncbi:MAG: alpha/beta fold hydrolase [Anaerolineae bacterium]|nr:alpha/beta fold hydrolase [Anaerolineae bacterium]NIN96410.1 alpha/beta fold hydrolase [Anaerolineae bacterium]NIQ79446.1 alpha/beta fold hydrolase [Anaerolineae bacterium]
MLCFNANGLDIFYELHGNGEPMLLLHGFGRTGESDWKYQIPVFADSYQLIAPDLRGHGRTDHPETISGPGFFQLATCDMVALLSALDVGPTHVCGSSMGSTIAIGVYFTAPSLVKSLILVSAAARVNRKIAKGLFDLWESMADPDGIDPGWARGLARMHGEERWRILLQNYGAAVIAALDQDEEIAYRRASEINCPTVIVQGGKDLVSPPILSEELHAGIRDSELVLLDCEHWVQGLLPDEFNETVLGFLGRRFPGESSE